eukprot:2143860-Pyramimonas_sp.AAC.1
MRGKGARALERHADVIRAERSRMPKDAEYRRGKDARVSLESCPILTIMVDCNPRPLLDNISDQSWSPEMGLAELGSGGQ